MQKFSLDILEWEVRFTDYLRMHMTSSDGSHDLGHFLRVWKGAQYINEQEGGEGDVLVLLAASMFHDWISLPKNHAERGKASKMSADATAALLVRDFPNFPTDKIAAVVHAIHAHSFSARVAAETVEAKILQDADRLEALGAIGLARVFYTAGQLSQALYDPEDPLAEGREADDRRFSLDHFALKLLKLPEMMNTVTGRRLADERAGYLAAFRQRLYEEIKGELFK